MALSWLRRRPVGMTKRWPGSGYSESTLAQAAWERRRKAAARWGWAGSVCGAVMGVAVFAPAAWLADAVASGTQQRVLLADARGTVWSGSAIPVLTAGPDSHSAAMLPGRTNWRIGMRGFGLEFRVRQSCCINEEAVFLIRPGLGRVSIQLQSNSAQIGEWPAAWLAGLGAPWNTLQLGGSVRLSTNGLTIDVAAGRWSLIGQADLDLNNVASPLTTLDRLGSYRVHLAGSAGGPPSLALSTLDGALLLNGTGQWTGSQFRFRGEARAAPGSEGELDNLLNFFGRRQGALSLISIG